MREEIGEYEKYLASFNSVDKPQMPRFDVSAYNDNEYLAVVNELLLDFDSVDDMYLTIQYLKGK